MEAEGNTGGEDRSVPLLVIQSIYDEVQCEQLAGAAGERCSYFDAKGKLLVETVFYEGRRDAPTHYWPGDSDDPPYADVTGPSATDALLDFFEREGL